MLCLILVAVSCQPLPAKNYETPFIVPYSPGVRGSYGVYIKKKGSTVQAYRMIIKNMGRNGYGPYGNWMASVTITDDVPLQSDYPVDVFANSYLGSPVREEFGGRYVFSNQYDTDIKLFMWSDIVIESRKEGFSGNYEVISEDEYNDILAVKRRKRRAIQKRQQRQSHSRGSSTSSQAWDYSRYEDMQQAQKQSEINQFVREYESAEEMCQMWFESATDSRTRRYEGGHWVGYAEKNQFGTTSFSTSDAIYKVAKYKSEMKSLRERARILGHTIERSPYENCEIRY